MKKKIFIVLFAIAISFLTFAMLNFDNKYKQINFSEYKKLYNSNESFVLFLGSRNCGHCTMFKKTAERIVKEENIKINYLELETLNEEEYAHINAHFPIPSTPTTVVIKNKKEIARISGAKNFEDSLEILNKVMGVK